MIYLLTFITALIMASGQTFWKKAAVSYSLLISSGNSMDALLKTLLSLNFIFGAFLYVCATMVYLWLMSRYPFFVVQISMVAFSIILALFIASIIFREHVSLINYFGVLLVISGIFFVVWKR